MRAPTRTSYNQAVEVPIEETFHYGIRFIMWAKHSQMKEIRYFVQQTQQHHSVFSVILGTILWSDTHTLWIQFLLFIKLLTVMKQ